MHELICDALTTQYKKMVTSCRYRSALRMAQGTARQLGGNCCPCEASAQQAVSRHGVLDGSGRAVHANMCPEEGYLSQLLSKVCLKPVPPPIFLTYLCSVWADVLDPLVLVPGWQCECHFRCQGRCESRDHCPSAMKLGPLRRPPQRPSALAPQTCTPRSFGRRGSAARSETTATS